MKKSTEKTISGAMENLLGITYLVATPVIVLVASAIGYSILLANMIRYDTYRKAKFETDKILAVILRVVVTMVIGESEAKVLHAMVLERLTKQEAERKGGSRKLKNAEVAL